MTLPRSQLICPSSTPNYHCIGRCVRRAFLCGEDALTGKDYSHRKGWVLARLALLAEVFTIELCAYAVMSNHYHLVLHINHDKALSLSHDEVISRWGRLFRVPDIVKSWQNSQTVAAQNEQVEKLVALWRQRLCDVSWYMRCLNEHIARQANIEDGCKGRFWEGRFKSQAILDKEGLLACMIYVDLNPLRASLVATPEESADVSIHQRRQILLIVDVAMAHIEGMASLDQDAVICQHRELQYHLIYFCVAVSAHVGEVLFFLIQHGDDLFRCVFFWKIVSRAVIEKVS